MSGDRIELARLAVAALSKRERANLLRTFAAHAPEPNATPAPDRIVRRNEAARLLGRSGRAIDRLAAAGILRKVMLPHRTRAAGFRESDIAALISEGGASR